MGFRAIPRSGKSRSPMSALARQAVLGEYDRWAKKHPNDARMMGGFLFFRYLQKEKSDLLDFRAIDDEKWQIVHGWNGIGRHAAVTMPSTPTQ